MLGFRGPLQKGSVLFSSMQLSFSPITYVPEVDWFCLSGDGTSPGTLRAALMKAFICDESSLDKHGGLGNPESAKYGAGWWKNAPLQLVRFSLSLTEGKVDKKEVSEDELDHISDVVSFVRSGQRHTVEQDSKHAT